MKPLPTKGRRAAARPANRLIVVSAMSMLLLSVPAWAQSKGGNRKPGGKRKPKPAVKIRLPESVLTPRRSAMQVTGVSVSGRSDARRVAADIDRYVERKLVAAGGLPADRVDDPTFLRRVYLDVAGRIPTLAEARAFLESAQPSKREDLIDELLGSPDSVSHLFNFWADVLRFVDRPQPNIIAEPFAHYVKESIRTNRPYDEWVYEMLTADGKSWDNPAVGYQLRDDGMALPYIDNTVRVFLGTQIGCAQCHDHPFQDWSQYQFYELAAYTAGVSTRIRRGDPGFKKQNPANVLINQAKEKAEKGRVPGYFQRIVRANTFVVSETDRPMRLPKDYAYADAKPGEIVEPAVPWGEIPDSRQYETKRQKFAAWLTSSENESFGKTVANRLWKHFMGVGMVEPVDDFSDDNPCVNDELMDTLTAELTGNGFDLKQLMRAILYSQTYQQQAQEYDASSGQPYLFPGPTIRRMTAEQIWDSMLTLAVRNPLPFERPSASDVAAVADLDFATVSYEQVMQKSLEFNDTYFRGTYNRNLRRHAYKGNVLCRASELPSPVPGEHFLRQFGQGDRESINGSDRSATVPQILAMFNGPITHVMLEAGSAIVDNVLEEPSTRDRVDAIFLSVLSRPPNGTDRRVAASEIAQNGGQQHVGYGNIIWALLNTREFMFIH